MAGRDTAESEVVDADGCRRLACAVIHRAVEDATTNPRIGSSAEIEQETERLHATLFLTSGEGRWAKSRGFWASLAGLDPDVIAERVRGMLNEH